MGTGKGGSVNRAFREATEQDKKLIDNVKKELSDNNGRLNDIKH